MGLKLIMDPPRVSLHLIQGSVVAIELPVHNERDENDGYDNDIGA
jgi:hypothetical protein